MSATPYSLPPLLPSPSAMPAPILILASDAGWHTDELCRAVRAHGHEPLL